MFGGLRKKLEELTAQANPFDGGKTAATVRAARTNPAPARTVKATQPARPMSTQQRVDQSYGAGFGGVKNRLRDVFDANTEADKIKRYSATGLAESFAQEQARKTQAAQNDPTQRSTVQQITGNALGGLSEFAKLPSQAMKMKGNIENSTLGKVATFANPTTQASAIGDELWKRATGQDTAKKRNDLYAKVGGSTEEAINNKIQQSGLGNRNTDNRIVAGVSRAGGQLLGQVAGTVASGGSTLPSAAMGLQTASSQYDQARKAGKSNDYAVNTGLGQGIVSGALEKVGFDKLGGGGNRLVGAVKGFGTEGAQEGVQQLAQNLITNRTYNPNQGIKEGVAESALIGGITGGVAGPLMGRPTKPTTSLVAPKPTRTRLRPEEARIWSDYQETLYKGNRMPAQVVNETHNKARQIADSLGVDIITGSPDEIAGRMNPLLEQSMAFQKEPTTGLVSRVRGSVKPLNSVGGGILPTPLDNIAGKLNNKPKPPTPFEQNLQTAGLTPKKSKGLVVSETKPLNGQKIQKVRTAPGKVEQRVVQDTTLDNLEKQKRQMVDSEARPVRAAELEAAQKQKELRKDIRSSGGIGSSDYESIPTSLKRKGGRAFDDLATEIGFEDGDALYNELNSHTEPRQFNDIREVVENEIKKGNSPLSDQYKELLQQIDDRKAELLRYPDGAKVVRNRQEFPTQDEFNALLSTPESQNPNNKTRAAVSNATSEVKQEQRSAVLSGDLTKAQQLREKVGTIETGLEQKAPDLSKNPEFIDLGNKMLKTIKDKKVRKQFETVTKEYLGSTRSAEIERQSTIAKLNKQFKLNQDEKLNAILASDSKTVKPMNDKVAKYVAEFHKLTDQAYKGYTEQGVKMGYVSSYLPRIYKNPNTGQLLDTVEYNLLQQSSKRTKGREADIVAKDWLVEKDPTKLLEKYYSSMDRMVAGQRYLKQLEQNGLLVKSDSPVSGLRPIIAEGLQPGDGMAYYAPKDVAGKLNHLFGSQEATNLVEKTLEKGAGVNSLFQSFVLSGGVPNTPINAFGMMQLLKEGMALHPVKAGRAFFGGGLSKSYANKVFTAKKDVMKLMAQNDLDIRVNLEQTGKWGNKRIRDAFKNEGKAAGLNQAWNEFTNDATFGRFMPMLEVLHFENVYKHQLKGNLIRKPKSSAEAARIAAESTKNFYGKTSVYKTSTRSKAVDDAAGALLFAPRFRESMVNFWVKNAKALAPTNYGKTEYRDNQKFMVASAVMYAAMTMLNEAMNGARMDENPDGKKDKLIMPANVAGKFGIDTKGKDIAVPFLPSIATVPRNLASLGANLATGKFNEAGKNAKAFASMPVKTVGDILTNEDYFGNKIVQDDSSPIQKFTQAASYVASSNMQPWIREGLNAKGQNLSKETKKTWGIKEKSTFEALSNAGELPLRFYKPDTYRYGENWTPKGGKDEKFDFKQQRERAALGGEIKNISKTLKLNKRQDELFKSLSSVEFNDDGTLKEDNNPFYKSQRYTALQDDGVFEAMKQKSKLNAKLNGKPIDPIFADDLAPDQRRVLLWKKTLPPGTSDPTVKKLYEQDWYQDYRNKESAYFEGKKAWNKKMGYKEATPNTNEYPMASKDVEDAQNAYFNLPKGGARTAFRRNNPDVWNKMIAFWDSKDAWTNGERSKLGLGDIEDEYASTSGSKGGKRGGKGSKGGSKYDYTKNLFASGGDSASTSKQLRAILERAVSGKS